MVGVKGMRVQHRAFTYQEKKFNQLGRSGLLDYFKPKISPQKIQDRMFEEHNQNVTMVMCKRVARAVERKIWEENEEEREFTEITVEMILRLSNRFDITNIEAFAMTLHLYRAMGGKRKLTEQQASPMIRKATEDANKLRLENWDRFMRILKEVR